MKKGCPIFITKEWMDTNIIQNKKIKLYLHATYVFYLFKGT